MAHSPATRSTKRNSPVTEAELVARLLADRDFDCPKCRYPLRGIAGNICPECGMEITRSRVLFNVANWRQPPFFFGIAAIIFGVVPALLSAFVIIHAWLTHGSMSLPDWFNMFLLFVWFATLWKLVISWVNWSSTMAAWPRWRHWLTALACWNIPALGAAISWRIGVFG